MKHRVFKGLHFCLPPVFRVSKKKIWSWEVTLDKSMQYDHGDNDQYDWNKLLGIKAKYWQPHYRTCMVGWRWNLETQRVELNAYVHDYDLYRSAPKNRNIGPVMVAAPLGSTVKISIHIHGGWWLVQIGDPVTGEVSKNYIPKARARRWWEIRHYFGGNRPAPHTISIDIDKH